MIPLEGEGDIPSLPGHSLPIGVESSVGCYIQDLGVVDPSVTIEPVPRACGCKVCTRSPILLASHAPTQDVAGGYQAGPTPR